MPFFPVIGSSFDNVANQQLAFAGLNNRVQEANLSRASEAEQTYNRYLANIAAMRSAADQRSTDMQVTQDALQRQEAWQREQARQRAAEFQQQVALSQTGEANRLAEERHRSDVMARGYELKDQLARDQAQQNVDLTGQSAAQNYAGLKRQAEDAQKKVSILEDEQSRLKERQLAIESNAGKKHWYGGKVGMSEDETAEYAANAARLKALEKILAPKSELVRDAERAQNYFEKFRENFLGTDFTLDEDAGVVRHKSGKAWNFSKPTGAAPADPAAQGTGGGFAGFNFTPVEPPVSEFGVPSGAPSAFAGFGGTTETASTVAAPVQWKRDASGKIVPVKQ